MSRCTGHCCESFNLPYDLETIERRKLGLQDGEQIAAMLVPIPAPPPGTTDEATRSHGGAYWYTCLNYKDGDCQIYATRPAMCSGFPDYSQGGNCGFTGCTMAKVCAK